MVANPAYQDDRWTLHDRSQALTFIDFTRARNRFVKQFGAAGGSSTAMLQTQAERLRKWRMLHELAGLRKLQGSCGARQKAGFHPPFVVFRALT